MIRRKVVAALSLVKWPWLRRALMKIWANGNHDKMISRTPSRRRAKWDRTDSSNQSVVAAAEPIARAGRFPNGASFTSWMSRHRRPPPGSWRFRACVARARPHGGGAGQRAALEASVGALGCRLGRLTEAVLIEGPLAILGLWIARDAERVFALAAPQDGAPAQSELSRR